jgi:hypothetical protein
VPTVVWAALADHRAQDYWCRPDAGPPAGNSFSFSKIQKCFNKMPENSAKL